jgi:3-hydroxyacyl-[acyl-carrier protein] dehydratase/trans-2-decenoyl-[acyl-carrier protein] isomerase
MVVPTVKKVEYVIDMKRIILRKLKLAIADGIMTADGVQVYSAKDLRVGLFDAGTAMPAAEAV